MNRSRARRTAGRTLVVALLCAALMAPGPTGAAGVRERAEYFLSLDYHAFAAASVHEEAPFDWSTDGCSGPTPTEWAPVFYPACVVHDFGYRNYGLRLPGGLHLDASVQRRRMIDDRLLQEMLRICYERPGVLSGCENKALVMYRAVRAGGLSAFWGAQVWREWKGDA